MSPLLVWCALAACLASSAAYSGSETGMYGMSRVRVDLEARRGRRAARATRWLLRNEGALLVTILIGNNLAIELATHFTQELLPAAHHGTSVGALYVTIFLSPVLFLFGEVLPKELFRRRPHARMRPVVPFIVLSRILYWPLELVVSTLTWAVGRAFGLPGTTRSLSRGRELVRVFLAEGRRTGALSHRAEVLAQNALNLKSTPIERAMVPWGSVSFLERSTDQEIAFETVRSSRFSRLPVVDEDGAVLGYVHQLDVLAAGPEAPVLKDLHALPTFAPDMPVDRALLALRGTGRRAAIVGSSEAAPIGILTLKDLVEEISGELVGI